MSGTRKLRRWRFSFNRSAAAVKSNPPPPGEFLCPISKSLMFDPAVVSSGQTFERACVDVCRDLGFTPTLADGTTPDFSTVIPNLALKTAILNWCSKTGSDPPIPLPHSEIESVIRSSKEASGNDAIRNAGGKLTTGVAGMEIPAELKSREVDYSSPSSEESVIANTTPFSRPSCLSFSSSPSTSSEFVRDESPVNSSGEDENLVARMKSLDVYDQEQSVIELRNSTRTDCRARSALCTDRVLLALKRLMNSRYAAVQINAAAALVNLSLEKENKIRIMRAGIVPFLIDILKNGFEESREHVAGAIFSLALEDENKTAIGVLGALPPLLHELRCGTRRSRQDAALALYHLTLVQSNKVKLAKLGAAGVLLGLLKDEDVAARVVLVLCNLATSGEGRAALLDSDAVGLLVGVMRNSSESTRENCVAALYSLSYGSLRFKSLAKDAGAAEALQEVAAATGSEPTRARAMKILERLRVDERRRDSAGELTELRLAS
ncbi:U-box domain-containing protein 38-like [Andrographis paniculata]|uniref:U-box domain-containing protein 38-like n=1 Tax=Andrographis paniculata TaxID=175694 RepID=UPI0021E791F8|nr:U-box domain-containing protein 38-like [Andrographis paniculata]